MATPDRMAELAAAVKEYKGIRNDLRRSVFAYAKAKSGADRAEIQARMDELCIQRTRLATRLADLVAEEVE